MDALKAELARKKATKESAKAAKASDTADSVQLTSIEVKDVVTDQAAATSIPQPSEPHVPSEADILHLFRQHGQPVRLFGESEADRLSRYMQLFATHTKRQLDREDHADEGDNTLHKRMRYDSSAREGSTAEASAAPVVSLPDLVPAVPAISAAPAPPSSAGAPAASGPSEQKEKGEKERYTHRAAAEHQPRAREDPRQGDKYIYKCFRGALYEWQGQVESMDRNSPAGRQAERLWEEAEDSVRPLLKLLKAGELPADIKNPCLAMVDCILAGDYKGAGDAYLSLAVGNAQWLIGVSQVGLHERAAREKVYLGKIAHVMNDETQRKYILSLKRCITWLQENSSEGQSADPSRKLLTR